MHTYSYTYPAYSSPFYLYDPSYRQGPEQIEYRDERFFPFGLGLAIPAAFIAGLAVPLLWNRPLYPPYPMAYPPYPSYPGYYGGFGAPGFPAYPPQMTAQAATSENINIYT